MFDTAEETILRDGTGASNDPASSTGVYDEHGNFFPGYYDGEGTYHQGWPWFDEDAQIWRVSLGCWTPEGDWVESAEVPEGRAAPVAPADPEAVRDFFEKNIAGDELEVAFLWRNQVLSVDRHEGVVRVGDDESCDFVLEDAAAGVWSLVEDALSPRVNVHESMHVVVRRGEETWDLPSCIESGLARPTGAGWYAIELVDRCLGVRVEVGEYAFLIRYSEPMDVAGVSFGLDREPIPFLTISAAAHILMLLLVMTFPDNARALELDAHLAQDRFVQLAMEPERKEEELPKWLTDSQDAGEKAAAKQAGEEGDAGKPDEARDDRRMALKGDRSPEDIELKRARDMQIASAAGIASNSIASMFGDSVASVGSDVQNALGNLDGAELGASKGLFGFGVRCAGEKTGPNGAPCFGGGGDTMGSIGLAKVATKGKATGDRDYGRGVADVGDRDAKVPGRVLTPQPPQLTGNLDREIIQRVVRAHRREIKHCYENELQKRRNLAGEVVVKFTIMPTGRVVSAVTDHSSLKSPEVERCMMNKIKRWIFPEPDGGGTVIVRYPFRFSPG